MRVSRCSSPKALPARGENRGCCGYELPGLDRRLACHARRQKRRSGNNRYLNSREITFPPTRCVQVSRNHRMPVNFITPWSLLRRIGVPIAVVVSDFVRVECVVERLGPTETKHRASVSKLRSLCRRNQACRGDRLFLTTRPRRGPRLQSGNNGFRICLSRLPACLEPPATPKRSSLLPPCGTLAQSPHPAIS